MIDAPESFTTARLVLRRLRLSDARAIYEEYASDPAVTRYLVFTPHESPDRAVTFIERCQASWVSGEEFTWGITLKGDDRVVGALSVRPRGHMVELGYALARKQWGRGLMPEAVRAVVEWAAALEGVYRVWAFCDVDNPASARVLEKVGMTREGLLRRWGIHPNTGDTPRDCHVYSRVR